jgi:hypothetical protein
MFCYFSQLVLVENIPAIVCSQCDEITFSRQTAEQIRVMLHKAISMDVYAYAIA